MEAFGVNDKNEKRPAEVRRVLVDTSPPRAANHFGWTRVNDQFLIEVGYYDLTTFAHLLQQPGSMEIDWFVTDRFILDADTALRFAELFSQLTDEIKRHLKGREHAE